MQVKDLAEDLDILKWGSRNLKPTVGVKQAETDLTLTTSYQDITLVGGDLEIAPAVASKLLVMAVFDLEAANTADNETSGNRVSVAYGSLKLDSEPEQSRLATVKRAASDGATGADIRATASAVYVLTLSAAAHTIKLRAKREGLGATAKCYSAGTSFLYKLVAS